MGQHADFNKVTVERSLGRVRDERDRHADCDNRYNGLNCFDYFYR